MYGKKTEISVGIFMMAGIACLVYLSVRLGSVDLFGSDRSEERRVGKECR